MAITNSSAISVDKLNQEKPLNLQTLQPETISPNILQNLQSDLTNQFKTYTNDLAGLQAQGGTLGTQLEQSMRDVAGIPQQQLDLEKQAGLEQKRAQTKSALDEINRLSAEANIIPLEVQQESLGRGRTEAGIAPIESARLRENTVQALRANALHMQVERQHGLRSGGEWRTGELS